MNAAPNHEPPTTDQRLTRLEILVETLIKRFDKFEEVCATKADVCAATASLKAEFHETITSLIKWMVGIVFLGSATGIAAITLVLNIAVARITAGQQAAHPPAAVTAPAPKPR